MALTEFAVNVEYCQLLINRVISFKNILSNEFQWFHYVLFWEALSKLTVAGVADGNVIVQQILLQFSRTISFFSKPCSSRYFPFCRWLPVCCAVLC